MHSFETEFCVEPSHPALAGHFPGNPVVPGVVILGAVQSALNEWQCNRVVVELPSVKFVSPLLPGERLNIKLNLRDETTAGFECLADDRPVAQGKLKLQRKGE
ncbi:MAG: hydroxymyristoyl-ACP dehydratase [Pseudomonadota bacterium]